MNPLPLPVRVAAGLVATAVEQARELPRQIVEFPVTAISHTLQVSMRMQQKVTELAIKGDRALGTLGAPDDVPAWATFDDEEPPAHTGTASTVTALRPPSGRPTPRRAATPTPVAEPSAATEPDDEGPSALPGYPEMTIPQLRARLRKLSEEDLRALLDWETTHDDRPPFVTMLGNRITTVTDG